jgi:hypothetical protein
MKPTKKTENVKEKLNQSTHNRKLGEFLKAKW